MGGELICSLHEPVQDFPKIAIIGILSYEAIATDSLETDHLTRFEATKVF